MIPGSASLRHHSQSMSEDDMLTGLLEAAAYGGWCISHVRRSDLAIQMGTPGLPDLIGVHHDRREVIAWELKADRGTYRPGQQEWLAAFASAGCDARTVYPADYADAVEHLLGDRLIGSVR